jgi:hypothetical protein
MIGVNLMAMRGYQQAQVTRIASLAIRDPNLTPLLYIEVLSSSFGVDFSRKTLSKFQ